MGVRIFQLAKELGTSSKELMTYLRTQGHKITNHMCAVDETVAQILKDRWPKKRPAKPKKAATQSGGTASRAKREDSAAKAGKSSVAAAVKDKPKKSAPARSAPPERRAEESQAADKRGAKRPRPSAKKRFFPGASDYATFRRGPDGGPRGRGGRAPRSRGGGATATRSSPASTASKLTEATIQLPITTKDLSAAIGIRVNSILKVLFARGLMLNVNSYLDEEIIKSIGEEFEVDITIQKETRLEDAVKEIEEFKSPEENLHPRAPVVTFLGHVDHGKTSLLDYIRRTRVVTKEHGGITQHIGAYRVDDDERNIHVVFIDTPGHQAFTEMRARGADATDVAVLVVAADEGLMPQTEEAYHHVQAAGVPVIVALNKMDKPAANPTRVQEQLSNIGLQPVSWGGKTEFVEVSAVTGQGIDDLLELLSLESELLELQADPTRDAIGIVLEAERNTGRGNLATVLIQDGTLNLGDHILCGMAHGRVRGMWLNGTDDVDRAGPATPVQISGLSDLPEAGDRLYAFRDAAKARSIAEARQRRQREEARASVQKVSLHNFMEQFDQAEVKNLNLILKADVKGTLEALKGSLQDSGTEEVDIKILHSGVGTISQDDVLLADASSGIILGFNVGTDDRARLSADEKQVEIRTYNVIYELLDDVKSAVEDRLSPEISEESQGQIEILQVFRASKIGSIAGCIVRRGTVQRDSKVRVIRDGEVIHTGSLSSLKRFRDDVKEVREGFECGLKIAGYDDIREGDMVEAFKIVEKRRTL